MAGVVIVTTESIPGYEVQKYVGLVWASSARSENVLSELGAIITSSTGGEVKTFKRMMNHGRNDVVNEIVRNAEAKGANAVIGLKMGSMSIQPGAVDIYAYGTAVVAKKKGK